MTSDFLARRNAMKAEQSVINTSAPKKPDAFVKLQLSEKDRAFNLLYDAEISTWEDGFLRSIIEWLTRKSGNQLSVKQANKLAEMEADFGFSRYSNCDRDGKPYSQTNEPEKYAAIDNTAQPLPTPQSPVPPKRCAGFDDMDNDIPF